MGVHQLREGGEDGREGLQRPLRRLDTDNDGTVSFMEFSAYMGKAYGDFEKLKSSKSVKIQRGMMTDNYYSGISSRILSSAEPVEKKLDKMNEIAEKDEENM